MLLTELQAVEWQDILLQRAQASPYPDEDLAGDDDEDFDEMVEDENDIREIRAGDDLGEPDPEDDDHLPDEELQ